MGLCLIIAAISILTFENATKGEFVYDDKIQIVGNQLIQKNQFIWTALKSDVWAFKTAGNPAAPTEPGQSASPRPKAVSNYFRPAFVALLIAEHRLFGLDAPARWHVANIFTHAAVSILAFALLRCLVVGRPLSLAAGLVFAVHPVHVESVTWISGSPDLLMALGMFAAMIAADRLARPAKSLKPLAWLVLLLGSVLAITSKEVGIMVAPLAALVAFEQSRREAKIGGAPRSKPLAQAILVGVAPALLACVFLLLRSRIVGPPKTIQGAPDMPAVLTSLPRIGAFYLRQSFWPWETPSYTRLGLTPGGVGTAHPVRPVWPDQIMASGGGMHFWIPLLFGVIVGVASLISAWRSSIGRIGLASFVLTLAPALYIRAFPIEQVVRDRYLYVPLLGLLMILIGLVDSRPNALARAETSPGRPSPFRRYAPRTLAAVLIVSCLPLALKSRATNTLWLNDMALFSAGAKHDPNAVLPRVEVARLLSQVRTRESLTAAVEMYNEAMKLRPMVMCMSGRAGALIKLADLEGGPGKAAARYAQAEADARDALAALRITAPGAQPDAQDDLDERTDDTAMKAYDHLAVALQRQGKLTGPDGAAAVLRDARARNSFAYARLTQRLAVVLYISGDKQGAKAELEGALDRARTELFPESKLVIQKLAMLIGETAPPGSADEARAFKLLIEFLELTKDSVSTKESDVAEARAAATQVLQRAATIKNQPGGAAPAAPAPPPAQRPPGGRR